MPMPGTLQAEYRRYVFSFKMPSGTSRGILYEKPSYFLRIYDDQSSGIGECGLLPGLSIDPKGGYENELREVCERIDEGPEVLLPLLQDFPSLRFGVEMAFLDYHAAQPFILYPSLFTTGKARQVINGLIWMGDFTFMREQLRLRLSEGFRCIKMKIGAIDFEEELALLGKIRSEFRPKDLELRVDANGAFSPEEALEKLKKLSEFHLHSIEQPIRAGQIDEMARICALSPIPVALDEELIGVHLTEEKHHLLQTIRPQYIILKPSLIGGYASSKEWIAAAEEVAAGWWVTSALESNVGLNAIAQWTYTLGSAMPQGLGTGSLYTNNIPSPLNIASGTLGYDPEGTWNTTPLFSV